MLKRDDSSYTTKLLIFQFFRCQTGRSVVAETESISYKAAPYVHGPLRNVSHVSELDVVNLTTSFLRAAVSITVAAEKLGLS